jgi:hypothetical protein
LTPEGMVLKQILDWLAAKHILAFRMNTGAVASEYKGKQRFMRFGTPGMADILAFPPNKRIVWSNYDHSRETNVLWIEVKSEKGKQSELQKSFQKQVENYGHKYVVARGITDVNEVLS